MKSKFILILTIILTLSCFTAGADAFGYPEICFCSDDSFSDSIIEDTALVGDTYSLRIRWFPGFDNEGYEITVYDSNGNPVGEDSKTWTNTASEVRITITWDTAEHAAGRYTIVVTKKYYSSSRWNTVPSTSVLSITLINKKPSTSMIGVKDFVERCYSLILGRLADEEGLNNWVNLLSSKTATAAEIVNGFMESPEYINKNNSSEQTVNILYNTMLDRPADEAGKQNWVGVLNTSGSTSVINGFCGSQEFLKLCDDYGITAGSVQTNTPPAPTPINTKTGLEGFVERCYIQALNRNSDAVGLENWINILKNKEQSPKQVASGFVFSQEMISRNLSNEETVDMFYRLYLGREADPAGRASWIDAMNNGMTLEELNNGFADSQEFQNIVESYGL